MMHPVPSPRDTELVVSHGWIEGPLEAETKADPVVIWAKLHVLNIDIRRGVSP